MCCCSPYISDIDERRRYWPEPLSLNSDRWKTVYPE